MFETFILIWKYENYKKMTRNYHRWNIERLHNLNQHCLYSILTRNSISHCSFISNTNIYCRTCIARFTSHKSNKYKSSASLNKLKKFLQQNIKKKYQGKYRREYKLQAKFREFKVETRFRTITSILSSSN